MRTPGLFRRRFSLSRLLQTARAAALTSPPAVPPPAPPPPPAPEPEPQAGLGTVIIERDSRAGRGGVVVKGLSARGDRQYDLKMGGDRWELIGRLYNRLPPGIGTLREFVEKIGDLPDAYRVEIDVAGMRRAAAGRLSLDPDQLFQQWALDATADDGLRVLDTEGKEVSLDLEPDMAISGPTLPRLQGHNPRGLVP